MGVLLVEPCVDFIAKIVLGWMVARFNLTRGERFERSFFFETSDLLAGEGLIIFK